MTASCPSELQGKGYLVNTQFFRVFPHPAGEGTQEKMLNLGTQNEIGKFRIEHKPELEYKTRVHMLWQPSDTYQDIEQQQLPSTPTRTGYTVVEWGGIEI